MIDPDDLLATLKRLLAGTANDADRNALHTALTTGVFVTGERAVALGGNASGVHIATGDQIVFSFNGDDAATALAALGSITPPRLHQVPPPPADFTGREDEQRELLAAIGQGGVTISGLRGLGGIGKTALALKLVEQLKRGYPDAQFYLDLKGASAKPLTAAEALAHVVRAYHPAAKLPDSETDLRGLYLSVLEGQRAILLMDNAASAEQVEPVIPPSSCVLLVTSRQHFTLPGLVAKNLDTLSAADARDLLLTIAPRIGDRADEIAKLCGYLPLALRLAAGAFAKYINLKPADYIQRLQQTQQRFQLVEASLNLSYELLTEELKNRWRMLAVFPDSFADDAAASVWETDAGQTPDTLGELIAASMVEFEETSSRYRLHDLARLLANSKLSEEERTLGQKRYAIHYVSALYDANQLYTQGGEALTRGLAIFDAEWGNIQTGHNWIAEQDDQTDSAITQLKTKYATYGGPILSLRQHPRDWIQWLEIAVTAARQLKDQESESVSLEGLGLAYYSLGETHRASQFLEQALLIDREIGDRKGEGITLVNLGLAYADLGEKERAIEVFEQALLIAREVGYRRNEGNALGNLGSAYKNLGETERAIQFYEQALLIVREIGDRQGESNVLGNIGVAYRLMGDTRRAIEFYEQALVIDREIRDRRGESADLWNMSLSLDDLGERAEAIKYAEESLLICEQIENPLASRVREQLAGWRKEDQ